MPPRFAEREADRAWAASLSPSITTAGAVRVRREIRCHLCSPATPQHPVGRRTCPSPGGGGAWGRWLPMGGALRGSRDSCRDRPLDIFIFSRRQHLGTFPSFLLELPEPTQPQPGWGEGPLRRGSTPPLSAACTSWRVSTASYMSSRCSALSPVFLPLSSPSLLCPACSAAFGPTPPPRPFCHSRAPAFLPLVLLIVLWGWHCWDGD